VYWIRFIFIVITIYTKNFDSYVIGTKSFFLDFNLIDLFLGAEGRNRADMIWISIVLYFELKILICSYGRVKKGLNFGNSIITGGLRTYPHHPLSEKNELFNIIGSVGV